MNTAEQQRKDIEALRDPNVQWKTKASKSLRQWCYYIFWEALAKGIIERPEKCERCGGKSKDRLLDGHHESYYEPIKVYWLCRSCHRQVHSTTS